MKTKLCLLLLSIAISSICYSQKIIINGEETLRKLQWFDFTGKPDNPSPFYAYTSWKLKSRMGDVQFKNDSVIIKSFEVQLELDSVKSWVKTDKATDELLLHEQGHFNFGILCMNEIRATQKKMSFTLAKFQSELQELFRTHVKKYKDMEAKYDQETSHGKNKEQQEKWNTFFQQQLNAAQTGLVN